MIPLPDPPLDDGAVRLRPWREADAEALAAAWADPEVQRWAAVPAAGRRTADHARRWIAGDAQRRARDRSLDLVISPADPAVDSVLGEVGLTPAPEAGLGVVGWWVAAPTRGHGVATRGVTLLARWAERDLGLRVLAEIDPANVASVRVAENAGLAVRLRP